MKLTIATQFDNFHNYLTEEACSVHIGPWAMEALYITEELLFGFQFYEFRPLVSTEVLNEPTEMSRGLNYVWAPLV